MKSDNKGKASWKRRIFWILIGGVVLTSALITLLAYEFKKGPVLTSSSAMEAALDRAIKGCESWLKANADNMAKDPNAALLHMVNDMNGLHGIGHPHSALK